MGTGGGTGTGGGKVKNAVKPKLSGHKVRATKPASPN